MTTDSSLFLYHRSSGTRLF